MTYLFLIACAVGIFFLGRNWEKLAPQRAKLKAMGLKAYAEAQPKAKKGLAVVASTAGTARARLSDEAWRKEASGRIRAWAAGATIVRGALLITAGLGAQWFLTWSLGEWFYGNGMLSMLAYDARKAEALSRVEIDMILLLVTAGLYMGVRWLQRWVTPWLALEILRYAFLAHFVFVLFNVVCLIDPLGLIKAFGGDPAYHVLYDLPRFALPFTIGFMGLGAWRGMRYLREIARRQAAALAGPLRATLPSPIRLHRSTAPYVLLLTFAAAAIGFLLSTTLALVAWFGQAMSHTNIFPFLPGDMQLALWLVTIIFSTLLPIFVGLVGGGISMRLGAARLPGKLGMQLISAHNPIALKVQEMAAQIGLPPIKFIGAYESPAINAFVMGTNKNSITMCFSSAAVERLTREELEAVIGHELGHVANNDMFRMAYSRSVQESLCLIGLVNKGRLWVRRLLLFVSEVGIMHLSRSREFRADAIGARMTSPAAMAGALQKIADDKADVTPKEKAIATLGIRASLKSGWNGLFATHPPISARVAAIEAGTYLRRLPGAQTPPPPSSSADALPAE